MSRLQGILIRVLVTLVSAMALTGCGQFPSYSDLTVSDFEELANGETQEPSGADRRSQKATRTAAARFAATRELEKSGETEKAIKDFRRLTDEFPKYADPFHRLGVLLDQDGQADKSARYYVTAMRLAPKNAELLCDYGYSRYLQGDFELAERTLRRAIELDAKMDRAHNNLALVLVRQDKDAEAIESFEKAGFSAAEARKNLLHARTASRLSSSIAHSQP